MCHSPFSSPSFASMRSQFLPGVTDLEYRSLRNRRSFTTPSAIPTITLSLRFRIPSHVSSFHFASALSCSQDPFRGGEASLPPTEHTSCLTFPFLPVARCPAVNVPLVPVDDCRDHITSHGNHTCPPSRRLPVVLEYPLFIFRSIPVGLRIVPTTVPLASDPPNGLHVRIVSASKVRCFPVAPQQFLQCESLGPS